MLEILFDRFTISELPEDVTSVEMKKVYDEKFAKAETVGRTYYDAIMAQVERGICPICGVRLASTLDHYLPKAKVPTLSVTPSNLIPACRDDVTIAQLQLSRFHTAHHPYGIIICRRGLDIFGNTKYNNQNLVLPNIEVQYEKLLLYWSQGSFRGNLSRACGGRGTSHS